VVSWRLVTQRSTSSCIGRKVSGKRHARNAAVKGADSPLDGPSEGYDGGSASSVQKWWDGSANEELEFLLSRPMGGARCRLFCCSRTQTRTRTNRKRPGLGKLAFHAIGDSNDVIWGTSSSNLPSCDAGLLLGTILARKHFNIISGLLDQSGLAA
jgi:hypothetical protein